MEEKEVVAEMRGMLAWFWEGLGHGYTHHRKSEEETRLSVLRVLTQTP